MIPADEMFANDVEDDDGGPVTGARAALTAVGPDASGSGIRLDPIEVAIEEIRAGRSIVVIDDEDRENEGDLIFAASAATAELVGFMIRHTSGYICVPMTGADLDRLGLPPMTAINEDRKGTAYAVSVDARDVESTGI